MDSAPVAEVIRHSSVCAFFDTRGQLSRIIGLVSCDTPAAVTIDEVGDPRSPGTSLLTDTAQF